MYINKEKFQRELINQLLRYNFSVITSDMCEYALANTLSDGVRCADRLLLADVYSKELDLQFSVKTFKDDKTNRMIDCGYTNMVVEKRIGGVEATSTEQNDAILRAIHHDILIDEKFSLDTFKVSDTKVVLVGFVEEAEEYQFTVSESNYNFDELNISTNDEKYYIHETTFTNCSKNYFTDNSTSAIMLKDRNTNVIDYKWYHPNNPFMTRCLLKRYYIDKDNSFTFKVRKQRYKRPNDAILDALLIKE